METRRSKRLIAKDSSVTDRTSTSPEAKKKKLPTKVNNSVKSSTPPTKSNYFDKTAKPAPQKVTARGRNCKTVKSNYFESPVASEDSSEDSSDSGSSDYEPGKSPSSKKNNKSSYFDSPIISESDSEKSDYEPGPSRPKKQPVIRKEKNVRTSIESAANKLANSKSKTIVLPKFSHTPVEKFKKSYESESDSSSDESADVSKSLTNSSKTSNNVANANRSIFQTESDEEKVEDTKPTEYFDFTSVLSQVTGSTDEKSSSEKPTDVKSSNEKPADAKSSNDKKRAAADTRGSKKLKRSEKPAVKTEPENEEESEQMKVFELLAMGEDTDLSAKDIKESVARASEEYEIPKQVEVLLDAPEMKKKKRCNDLEIALKRRLNNVRRENQVYVHKVHILCWIAHGHYVNSILNSPELLAIALSLIPSDKCYPPKRMNLEYLEKLMGWFGKKVKLKKDSVEKFPDLLTSLQTQFQKLEAENKTNFCFLFICFLRALGLQCRLVVNMNVAPIKPPSDQLLPINPKKEESTPNTSKAKPSTSKKSKTPEKSKQSETDKMKTEKSTSKKSKTAEKSKQSETDKMKTEKSSSKKSKTAEKSKPSEAEKMKNEKSTSNSKKSKNEKDTKSEKKPTEATRRSTRVTKSTSKHVEESPSKSKSKTCKPSVDEMTTSDDSDFEETFVTPKKKIDRRVLSPEKEANESKSAESKAKKCGANYWLEVFLEMEEKWFCVDIVKKAYHCTKELYSAASHPVRYVLAWNNDKTIKDVTRRYVPQYLTVTKKSRVDENWWVRTMKPYRGPNTPQNREEDEELERKLEEQPLPTSISEYKNHPLYALQRHLLKFQGIYPADAPTLGFIRGEPVYSRQCVHQLHGREMWIKEAKVVKLNEIPYKIVKGRPQRNKFGNQEPPKDLELFGAWQVEDYVPPTAENGKVPRNPFGNVELFKPSMLPKGTVYLQLPGLQKIANKLNIDCAQAIVGFEYSTNGWSYPVKDGYVICEEFKDIMIDAYNQELQEAERKERQKREERVFGNWKRLIKGLFIREKLKRKYNFGDPGSSSKTDK